MYHVCMIYVSIIVISNSKNFINFVRQVIVTSSFLLYHLYYQPSIMTEKAVTDEFARRIREEIKKQVKTPVASNTSSSVGAYNELASLIGSLNVDIKTPKVNKVILNIY